MRTLPARMDLAGSAWPRTGGDRRNSGRAGFAGPRSGRIVGDIALPAPVAGPKRWRGGGIAVAADGDLVVVVEGSLLRVGLDGRIRSRARFTEAGYVSPPVALSDGSVLVVHAARALCFDEACVLVSEAEVGGMCDDSGLAPNLTHAGGLVMTYMDGAVVVRVDGGRHELGRFGYDIVPPALYDDDAMVIAGYAGSGAICVEPDGRRRWRAELKEADLLPAIDGAGFAAVGSKNEQRSIIVAPDGTVVGTLAYAAVFAEATGGDWCTRSDLALTRVRRDGGQVWSVPWAPAPGPRWGAQAPITDDDDRVYALTSTGLGAVDATTGARRFELDLGAPPCAALALVAPGLAAVLYPDRLVLVG